MTVCGLRRFLKGYSLPRTRPPDGPARLVPFKTLSMHTIRRLNAGEAAIYRSLRLEALKDSPEAFATTYDSALHRDEDSWIEQADSSAQGEDRAVFLVLDDRPIGMAALYRDPENASSGELLQMWIASSYRGGSTAVDLLDHLFQWASEHGFSSIRAEVRPGNGRALRFYGKYGFRQVASSETTLLTKAVRRQAGPCGGVRG